VVYLEGLDLFSNRGLYIQQFVIKFNLLL